MDSTKPASRSTRRCFDTVGWGIPSRRSISPTDCCDETRRLNIARRFGSAMISNTDSTLFIYCTAHMPVKAYKEVRNAFSRHAGIHCPIVFWPAQFRAHRALAATSLEIPGGEDLDRWLAANSTFASLLSY